MDDWFLDLFGVREGALPAAPLSPFATATARYAAVQSCFEVTADPSLPNAQRLHAPNGHTFALGAFSTPSLASLRALTPDSPPPTRRLTLSHIATHDALALHGAHPRACVQAASQFNCLEFASPRATPELGVGGYAHDPTQGPACALACAPGAVFRTYFAPVGGRVGQTERAQVDTLRDVLGALGNAAGGVRVVNGYVEADGRAAVARAGRAVGDVGVDAVREKVRVGVVRGAGVVYAERGVRGDGQVTQVYCAAVSVAYSSVGAGAWEPLARAVLDGAYEATLRQAEVDRREGVGSGVVLLTLVGGGVFGNRMEWIADAIGRAVVACAAFQLDVRVCHFRRVQGDVVALVDAAVQREWARVQGMGDGQECGRRRVWKSGHK